jgi:MobA/MobL family protein
MPHMHFRRTVYKSGGQHAAGRVSYVTREPVRAQNASERQVRYLSRSDREDLVYTRSRNLPAWAEGKAQTYFRAAEQYEWALGNAFEEWKITLPQELTHGQNMALMRALVDVIAGDRLPITYAFHCPATLDHQQEQPHLHLLISARQNDGISRTPQQHFKKCNRTHPERGGAPKDPALYHLRAVKAWRVTISDVVNLHLERAGCPERVHPDRLDDQGIDRQPEPKLVPSESREYREKGVVSEKVAEVLAIRTQRQSTQGKEQAHAREYWEARKLALSLTDAMDLPAQLSAIGTARALRRDQATGQMVRESAVGVEQDERALGELAEEAVVQAQAEGQMLWLGVEDLEDAWQLRRGGQERVQEARTEAQGLWQDAQDAQRRRDVGSEAADDAWRDAVLLWAEEQGARALRDVGWEAVQEAREEGHEALQAAWQERWQRLTQAPAWTSLEHDLQALARQLDALREEEGGTGRVRVRLWDREQGLGL